MTPIHFFNRQLTLIFTNRGIPYQRQLAQISGSPMPSLRQIHVRFFAILREQAGCSAVEIASAAPTPAALYAELQTRHAGLTFPATLLRVSINERYADMAAPLAAGDRVVFIPPVAGG
jgi:molybdopterin synthase sulfur carrier subunit